MGAKSVRKFTKNKKLWIVFMELFKKQLELYYSYAKE